MPAMLCAVIRNKRPRDDVVPSSAEGHNAVNGNMAVRITRIFRWCDVCYHDIYFRQVYSIRYAGTGQDVLYEQD